MTNPEVLVVGAGFSGIYLMHKLKEANIDALCVEAAPDLGGTWFLNRYPGCRCDIESMEYSFTFSEELRNGWDWSEKYSAQPEILSYVNWVADKLGVRKNMIFNTPISKAHWNADEERWHVAAEDGRTWQPRIVIMATGGLTVPKNPDIPGFENFKGEIYHVADWPNDPIDVSDKKLGVIGTGSSGIQVSTALAPVAGHLSVFQRTPSYSVAAQNKPLSGEEREKFRANWPALDAWARSSKSGLMTGPAEKATMDYTPEEQQKMLQSAWEQGGAFHLTAQFTDTRKDEEGNMVVANFVKDRIRERVKDPKLAELLCPDDLIATRRICVDTGYYEIFNQENVSLVDTKADAIVEVTETGLRLASGEEHPLDILVLATGYDAITGALSRIDLKGEDGATITDAWAEGPKSLYGLGIAGFPNLFTVGGPISPGALANAFRTIEPMVDWIAGTVSYMQENNVAVMTPTKEGQEKWTEHAAKVAAHTLFTKTKSWYMGTNIPGKPQVFMAYAGGVPAYVEKCGNEAAEGYPNFDKRIAGKLDEAS
jgi:cation diffusion facilitator CzcD-associated flavoprotein CzcO